MECLEEVRNKIKYAEYISKNDKENYLKLIFGEHIINIFKERAFSKEYSDVNIQMQQMLSSFGFFPPAVEIDMNKDEVYYNQVSSYVYDFDYIYKYLEPLMLYWYESEKNIFYKKFFNRDYFLES